jgi:predicted TIM-barrel fold metal-dependent hydrolase
MRSSSPSGRSGSLARGDGARKSGAGIFDAHLHIIDPAFPLRPNQGYLPAPFTVDDYLAVAKPLGITGGAVVSGSFQGEDQTYLEATLARLGPGFVGVTQLPPDVPDAEVRRLDALGVRAVRLNLHRGASGTFPALERLAHRAFDLCGWHAEVYVDAATLDDAIAARLAALPRISIDHLGLSAAGLPTLLRLVERGARVKATGFGRVDMDVPDAIRRIAAANPGALLFGTDLPSTRAGRPFAEADIDIMCDTLDAGDTAAALRDNAHAWYRPPT